MTDPGEWLLTTAKCKPEALLVLAAGCALLLRGSGRSFSPPVQTGTDISPPNTASAGLSRATEKVAGVASNIQARLSGTASSITEQAGGIAKTLSTQTSQAASTTQSMLNTGFGQLLRDQPFALVAAGLAAGAAIAALLPATEIEERTLGNARDAISSMSANAGQNIASAANEAGQRLTQEVTERAGELKDVATDIAQRFTNSIVGTTDKSSAPSNVSPLPNRST